MNVKPHMVIASLAIAATATHCDRPDHSNKLSDYKPGAAERSVDLGLVDGGDSLPENAYPNVGMFENAFGYCTGIAICPNLVITAGHCAKIIKSGATFNTANSSAVEGKTANVKYSDAETNPGLESAQKDIMLVVLDKAVMPEGFQQPINFDFSKRPEYNDKLELVGYGPKYSGDKPLDFEKTSGTVEKKGPEEHARCKAINFEPGPEGQTSINGDSGGPLFNQDGDLVGINSGTYSGGNFAVDLIFWKPWIEQMIEKYCDKA